MFKKNIYYLHFKELIIPIIFLCFILGLLLFSNSNLTAAKSGLLLWLNSVVPSLLPFFVATELLCHTKLLSFFSDLLTPIMKPIFNINGEGGFALIMGIISGYPTGAKIASNFRNNNICNKEECERLLSFTNNSGPLFIIGTIGTSMFGNSTIGYLLFITHFLSSITVGIIFRFWKYNSTATYNHNNSNIINQKNINILNIGEVLGNSITNSISTIMMIGGYVILFSVIISILRESNLLFLLSSIFSPIITSLGIPYEMIKYIITGLLEITNGINGIANINIKEISINIIVTALLLGFGGISVMLQVLSIISKTDLSPKAYIIGKLLHGFFAALYTYSFIAFFPIFNFDL